MLRGVATLSLLVHGGGKHFAQGEEVFSRCSTRSSAAALWLEDVEAPICWSIAVLTDHRAYWGVRSRTALAVLRDRSPVGSSPGLQRGLSFMSLLPDVTLLEDMHDSRGSRGPVRLYSYRTGVVPLTTLLRRSDSLSERHYTGSRGPSMCQGPFLSQLPLRS